MSAPHMRSLQLHNIINLGAMARCSLKRMQVLTLFSSLLAEHSKPSMKGKDQLCCSHRDAVLLYSSTWLPLWVVKRRSVILLVSSDCQEASLKWKEPTQAFVFHIWREMTTIN